MKTLQLISRGRDWVRLIMSVSPRFDEALMERMLELKIDEVEALCSVSPEAEAIYSTDQFWIKRAEKSYPGVVLPCGSYRLLCNSTFEVLVQRDRPDLLELVHGDEQILVDDLIMAVTARSEGALTWMLSKLEELEHAQEAFDLAVKESSPMLVKRLLDIGVEFDTPDVIAAAVADRPGIVDLLLSRIKTPLGDWRDGFTIYSEEQRARLKAVIKRIDDEGRFDPAVEPLVAVVLDDVERFKATGKTLLAPQSHYGYMYGSDEMVKAIGGEVSFIGFMPASRVEKLIELGVTFSSTLHTLLLGPRPAVSSSFFLLLDAGLICPYQAVVYALTMNKELLLGLLDRKEQLALDRDRLEHALTESSADLDSHVLDLLC